MVLQAVKIARLLNFCIHEVRGFCMCQISKDNVKKPDTSIIFSPLMLNLHSHKLCPAPGSHWERKSRTQHKLLNSFCT